MLVDEGSYGKIYETSDPNVLEKRIEFDEDYALYGLDWKIVREIATLKALQHSSYVVPLLKYTFQELTYVSLFFKRYKMNLFQFYQSQKVINVPLVLFRIIMALLDAENLEIYHRDLKPQNIFLNDENDVVLGDFGLSRFGYHETSIAFSNPVQTLIYRAPELLLGATRYSNAIEVWSLGCLFFELETSTRLFSAETEKEQILNVFKLFGTPNETECSNLTNLPLFSKKFPLFLGNISSLMSNFSDPLAFDLFSKMLLLDPAKRYSLTECLQHPYFNNFKGQESKQKSSLLSFSYMPIQVDVSDIKRMVVLEWIYELSVHFKTGLSIFFQTSFYLDLYLSKNNKVQSTRLQLIAIVCFILACKISGNDFDKLSTYQYLCADAYTLEEFQCEEMNVLKVVDFQLCQETAYSQLQLLCKDNKKAQCLLFLANSNLNWMQQSIASQIFDYVKNNVISMVIQDILTLKHVKSHIFIVEHILNVHKSKNFPEFKRYEVANVPTMLLN